MKVRSTVIVPNYNGIKYIGTCLESLKKEDAHIIVVDNGSSDGSWEYIRENYPSTEIVRFNENKGFCAAINAGIKLSDTEFVIFLNNDTKVMKGFVRALESAMDEDKKIFSASAKMLMMNHPDTIDDAGDYYCSLGWAFADGKGKKSSDYNKKKKIFSACGGAAIFRKSILDEIGYLDENHFAYLEDVDLGYRARIAGYKNVYAPLAKVLHAGSAVSGSRYNKFKVDLTSANSVYIIYKNMPAVQIALNLPFLLAGFAIKTVFFARIGLGRDYVYGLFRGLAKCASEEGRKHKVHFDKKNILNYIEIQMELLSNMVRRVVG